MANASDRPASWRGIRVYTIGHSTRTLESFVELLRAFEVRIVADVRTIPRSRHNPQFNAQTLGPALRRRRLRYVQLPELGGLRHARADSPNAAWRNASFRGFADYMRTPEFEAGLAKLRTLASGGDVALMCAEAVPFRCHRSLIADALIARGAQVEDIASARRANAHRLTAFAIVDGTRVTYPDAGGGQLSVVAPFHLEATVRVLQRRPSNIVDVWEQGRYLRVLSTRQGPALVEVDNRGSIDHPDLRFKVLSGALTPGVLSSLAQQLRQVLGLDVDPAPLQRSVRAEPRLASVAAALRGMRPPRLAGLFETFANVVAFQQVSLDAGVAAVARLVERFGPTLDHQGRRRYAFPQAHAVASARVEAVAATGLSRRKAEALRGLAAAIDSGEISVQELSRMSTPAAIEFLTAHKGLGPWSAHLVLLRGLGRLDAFPPGDVGVLRGLCTLLNLPPGPALDRIVQEFGQRRGYLYFYSLGGSLLAKGLIHPAPAATRHRSAPGRCQ